MTGFAEFVRPRGCAAVLLCLAAAGCFDEPTPAYKTVPEGARVYLHDQGLNDLSSCKDALRPDIVDYLNKYPKAKVNVTGYADAGTGNDRINDRLAAGRADIVFSLLTEKYNIPADRIMKDSKGSRVQPFAENDLNRVTICIAE